MFDVSLGDSLVQDEDNLGFVLGFWWNGGKARVNKLGLHTIENNMPTSVSCEILMLPQAYGVKL